MKKIEAIETAKSDKKTDKPWLFQPGDKWRGNAKGRPLGSRNFSTDFDEVLEEIAKITNISKSEARKILLKRAYSEAKDGNFPFYKDILDRDYGKAKETVDITSGGQSFLEAIKGAQKLRDKK